MLDFVGSRPPQLLPVLGNMQDALHENLDVDENSVAFEVLDNILFVPDNIVFSIFVHIRLELPQDGRLKGKWSWTRDGASCIGLALRGLQPRLDGRKKK